MSLRAGERLGPYEVLAPLGAGGMGEVWKARDTRLDRIVALKIAKTEFSQRFEREARAVAALNHPHICTLYDIGPNYLVMEYIEGTELKGPVPLAKAIELAGQILDALDAAHRKGIVHRDLKPGNILVTKSGVKVLDFGLAKMTSARVAAVGADAPTALTTVGMIAGTLYYMAPEQCQGKEVDTRADIFAFGCVVYEMLTGKRAFEGSNPASVIAAIIERPAPSISDAVPAALERVLRRCLEKDPDQRWQNARDIKINLEWAFESSAQIPEAQGAPAKARPNWWIAATAVCCLLLAVVSYLYFRQQPAEPRVIRSEIPPPEKTSFALTPPALSPDGRRLVLSAESADGKTQLWLRSLDSVSAQPLPGTEGATFPFWSPDSKSIGFFADSKLKRIDLAGGSGLTLADAVSPRGGAWSADGIIVFAPFANGPLQKVPASGGASSPLTKLESSKENSHRAPWFLPDGKHFLFFGLMGVTNGSIRIGSVDSPEIQTLTEAESNAVYAQGHLLFLRGNTLLAQPFDLRKMRLAGQAAPVAEQVQNSPQYPVFSVSASGELVYAAAAAAGSELTWFDRSGKRTGPLGEPGQFMGLFLSPDRKNFTVSIVNPLSHNAEIWICDVAHGLRTRFTFDPALVMDLSAVWSPDGGSIVFDSHNKGAGELYRRKSNGSGSDELLYADQLNKMPTSWSPDGRFLSYVVMSPNAGFDIWILPDPLGPPGASKPYPFLHTQFNEVFGQFSPDGKWMAYESDESGRYEINATPFPGPGGRRQISTGGGRYPRWRSDGKEIFYITESGRLAATEVTEKGDTLQVGEVTAPFGPVMQAGTGYPYDISADGQRILAIVPPQQSNSQPLTLVQNWAAGLKNK